MLGTVGGPLRGLHHRGRPIHMRMRTQERVEGRLLGTLVRGRQIRMLQALRVQVGDKVEDRREEQVLVARGAQVRGVARHRGDMSQAGRLRDERVGQVRVLQGEGPDGRLLDGNLRHGIRMPG